VKLARGDVIGLDGILFPMEGAQVLEKAASDFGRQFDRRA
jgi:hypothetical protein